MSDFCFDGNGFSSLSTGYSTYLSVCFLRIVLTQIINLIFIAISAYRLKTLFSHTKIPRSISINIFYYLKLAVITATFALKIAQLSLSTKLSTPSQVNAATVSDIISLVVIVISFLLTHYEHTRYSVQSHVLLAYYPVISGFTAFWIWTLSQTAISYAKTYFSLVCVELAFLLLGWAFTLVPNKKAIEYIADIRNRAQGECPEIEANIYSRIYFLWMSDLLKTGRKRILAIKDVWPLPDYLDVENTTETFEKEWDVEIARYPNSPNLWRVMYRSFGTPLLISMFLKLIQDILNFTQTLLFSQLLGFIAIYTSQTDNSISITKGFIISFAMLFNSLFQTMFLQQYFHLAFNTGIKAKTAITNVVFKKSMNLSNSARQKLSTGDIFNLMSVDANKISDVVSYINTIWSGPLQAIVCVILLYKTIGVSALTGVVVMVIGVPINIYMSKMMRDIQKRQMTIKDKRLRLIDEILSSIKSIKLYSWESAFIDKTTEVRNKGELKNLRSYGKIYGYQSFVTSIVAFLVSFLTFAIYSALDNKSRGPLNAQLVFVSLSLFNLLKFPLFILPMIASFVIEANVSCKRVIKLLVSEDLQSDAVDKQPFSREEGNLKIKAGAIENRDLMVSVTNGTFTWGFNANNSNDSKNDKKKLSKKEKKEMKEKKSQPSDENVYDEDTPSIKNINFNAYYGELIGIVGIVGSGKSSLVSALLGDMKKLSGDVMLRGRVAYVPQQPWIINSTLRENILFGQKYDKEFYERVIKNCELEKDIAMLEGGDMAEIGEKGINLSGGQKARLSLARAVYSRAHVYLLDDPLSAVDAHVGRNIMTNVIGPSGLLHNKCRILVTHAVQYLPLIDQVIVMDNGEICEKGHYNELINKVGGSLVRILGDEHFTKINENDSNEVSEQNVESLNSGLNSTQASLKENSLSRRASISTIGTGFDFSNFDSSTLDSQSMIESPDLIMPESNVGSQEKGASQAGQLIEDEVSKSGRIKLRNFVDYVKAGSISGMLIYLVSLVLTNTFSVVANVWLQYWSNQNVKPGDSRSATYYILIYGLFGLLQAIFLSTQNFTIWVFIAIRAAKKTHSLLLKAVMRSPMSFFDTTPLGRILNRFSKDQETIDHQIPRSFDSWASSMMSVLATLIVIVTSFPLFLVAAVPIMIAYYFVYDYYIVSSRELKRLESTTRSPIYSMFQECLSGVSTIRAYGHVNRFKRLNNKLLTINTRAQFPYISLNRWISIRLESIGALIIFFASLFAVITALINHNKGNSSISAARVGLAVSYSLSVTQNLSWGIRQTAELENSIVSVERNKEYCELPPEAPEIIPDNRPPTEWPTRGEIVLSNYSTRYREGLDLILRNINLTIPAGSKVGVVGRTGAGKSSLSLALFRIIESAGGKILIDGIDISTIGLKDLRSKIVIIPQDPVLFSETLRANLDPFNEFSDVEIWSALEKSKLKSWVIQQDTQTGTDATGSSETSAVPTPTTTSGSLGLNVMIQQGGANMSLGQRQLVCLARALLRRSKILILDEATAAIDVETDRFIQDVIRTEFATCTVITIAHRLNTIIDSDYILVLEKGEAAEFDNPQALLRNPDSLFTNLVNNANDNS
ncbi:Metal resistance protein YCF1 [Smittium culicis]|uniref:Metal resistance protein YCF1 n=1 Tax=Smittium culicis TaxID=133412 RepID=A0A1R1YB39_9FUNG|nr:Metal resistance protein YCF1 [Smittium culicis]OMJ24151.1 Metal resistance protein YCF1 [Smittium culicis]